MSVLPSIAKPSKARCRRCGAILGNAEATECPVGCDIPSVRSIELRFALWQMFPIFAALGFSFFYQEHILVAFGIAAGLNLVAAALSIRDGLTFGGWVERVVERKRSPVYFWAAVSLCAMPSIGFFAFLCSFAAR
jgi:hypothetical protein